MEIVSLQIKKVDIGKFQPKKGEVELRISFNDGSDKEIYQSIKTGDAERAAEKIVAGLRKMVKKANEKETERDTMESFVNVVVKEEDEVINEIARFIQKIDSKLEEINQKKEAEGYLDVIRNFKNLKLEL